MKYGIFIFLCSFSFSLFAQFADWDESLYLPAYHTVKLRELPSSKTDIGLDQKMHNYLNLSEDEQLVQINNKIVNGTEHIEFAHSYRSARILFSGIKLHLYGDGSVLIQNYLIYPLELPLYNESNHPLLLARKDGLFGVQVYHNETLEKPLLEYRTAENVLLYSSEKYRYFRDTTVRAKVFMVNPLNSSGKKYGGAYADSSNKTNSSLDSQLVEVQIPAQWRNDTFFLKHPLFEFKELSTPAYNDDYENTSDTFFYTRDMPRFEAVNAYYHLINMYGYLQDLGYENLVVKLLIDAHGLGGADNSMFDPFAHSLQFGTGGVDDAEDGEVVIHEFIHSISEIASPNTTFGKQRTAMEEGNCDYLAKSYSRSINDNHSYDVFSWDGHNEFWSGFIINSSDTYPEDLTNSKDGDRDMWSSCMMCIHDHLGRLTTDSIVLEHLNYQFSNATMPQMADILLDIDSIVFAKRKHSAIMECLIARGFKEKKANVIDHLEISSRLMSRNSAAFLYGTGDLIIESAEFFDAEVYNLKGQKIAAYQHIKNIALSPVDFAKGMYIIKIKTPDNTIIKKIMR